MNDVYQWTQVFKRKMSCLLPQFKCSPFKTYHFCCKSREPLHMMAQCILTMSPLASASSSVVDIEKKLRLSSVDANSSTISSELAALFDIEKLKLQSSSSIVARRPWIYTGEIGTPLVDEETVIAAVAAEAVALAKTAAEVAKDAKNLVFDRVQLVQFSERVETNHSFPFRCTESTNEELNLLRLQLSSNVAVKSERQIVRKAKRAKAAEKATSNLIPFKTGNSSRKKRSSFQEIDYSDPLRFFRSTTRSSRLLTSSEEHEFSEAIQELLKLERLHEELEKGFGTKPTFAQWAVAAGMDRKTLRKRLDYCMQCKDKMIKSNIRLVISIAKNYQGSGMSIQDLVQEGCRGLVRGAEKFDASKGFKFSTYAHWWIKQAVRKSLSGQSRTIRLPLHMVEATYRVKEARKQLYGKHGRNPNDEEVAEATGLSMKRLSAVLLTPKAPISLDQKIGFNQNLKLCEIIADPDAGNGEEMLTREFMKKDLNNVLDSLNKTEKQVIRWRFGLEDERMRTLQEIGELMGVSRERIRQIELFAFRKLKSKRRTKNLQQYLIS